MSRRSWLLLAALAATWGASYMFIKVGLRDFGAAFIVFGRTALAAAVLLPVAARRGSLSQLRGRGRAIFALAAVQVAGPFLLITLGERYIASALAGVLVAGAPIFTALIALRTDHAERSTGLGAVGVGVGMLGVVLLFGLDLSADSELALGGGMVLLAAAGYALGGLELKRRFTGIDPAAMSAATMSASALMTLPLVALDPPTSVGADSAGALLALGALGTGVAFLIFYTLILDVGPRRASIVAYIAPAFAIGYGALLLDETITAATVFGLLLILGGSWLAADGRLPGRRRGPGGVPAEPVGRGGPSGSTAPESVRVR